MSQQSQASRTECGTNGQLARTRCGANELKIREICARDQQHKTRQSKREPHHGPADAVRHGSLKWLEAQALALVMVILLADIRSQSNHTLLRLLNRDARLKACKGRELVGVAVPSLFLSKRQWLPHIYRPPQDRMFESGRHDPDYLDGLSVKLDCASEYVWVTSKTAGPKTIRQDNNIVSAGLELFRSENATVCRRHSKHWEKIGGSRDAEQTCYLLPLFSQVTAGVVVGSHPVENCVLFALIEKVGA